MGRESDIEKRFKAYLDRLLAGQEVPLDPAADQELRDALEFARKMKALGATPSAPFQARLKASLLQKLAEREARQKEKHGFWGFFRSHPAWQVAVAALFVIALVSIIWRAGLLQPVASPGPVTTTATTTATATTPAATQPPAPSPGTLVSATASTDKTAYQPGETVKIELELKNMSGAPLALAKLPPIVSLMQAQTGQAVYTSPPGKEVRTLAPQEVARFNYAWNQTDFNGRPVTGSYYIELEDLEYQGQPIQLNQGTPPRFEILPSTDNETGTRNFSSPGIYNGVTDNGIEITSWNLRISDAGITVDIMNTPPPDYTVTPSGSGYRANKNYSAAAVYSLDGNWIQEAGMSSVTYAPAGMTHTWLLPVRVPPETAEIYFEITGIGGREGSWPVNMTLK